MKFLPIAIVTITCSYVLLVLLCRVESNKKCGLLLLAQSNQGVSGDGARAQIQNSFSYRFRDWLNEPLRWEELVTQKFNKSFLVKLKKWLEEPAQWNEIKSPPKPGSYDEEYVKRFNRWWKEAQAWDELKTGKFDEKFIDRFKWWWNFPQTWLEPLKSKLSEPPV